MPAPAANGPQSAAAVALPPRRPRGEANGQANGGGSAAPVWSLESNEETQGGADAVPLAAKCDLHGTTRDVCCRELKGDDERHLIDPDIVRDVIIGLADGLTVPFALTAGLSSLGSSKLVYTAGVAELVSGSISMGIGGYLSAQAERDHYRYLRKTTRERVLRSCSGEMEREVAAVLGPLGIEDSLSRRIAGALLKIEADQPAPPAYPSIFQQCLRAIARRPKGAAQDEERRALLRKEEEEDGDKGMTAFLLKFGEGMEETTDMRLFVSAFTIGISYMLGGLVPLLPYFFIPKAKDALLTSIAISTVVLLAFGAVKAYLTGAEIGARGYTYGCLSTLAVGGAAAAASFGIVRALEGPGSE